MSRSGRDVASRGGHLKTDWAKPRGGCGGLGTAGYMSPEQARGRNVDRSADVWALACVTYEMLTGRPAFDGETITDILGAIVRADPDWNALPSTTPFTSGGCCSAACKRIRGGDCAMPAPSVWKCRTFLMTHRQR